MTLAAAGRVPREFGRDGRVAAAMIAATACLALLQAAGADLRGPSATTLSILAVLGLGLPHGALDIRKLRADPAIRAGRGVVLATYLVAAGLTAAIWAASPASALALFLVVAVVHFAIEASEDVPTLLAACSAGLVVALPAASHPQDVVAIFDALAGDGTGAILAEAAAVLAWPLLAVAAIAAVLRPPTVLRGIEVAVALAAFAILPPLPAFAVFFGLQHSPRHFLRTARTLELGWRSAVVAAVPATIGALGLLALLMGVAAGTGPWSLPAATFVLLSVLTVPHMVVGTLLRHAG